MNQNEQIVGHKKQLEFLDRAVKSEKLAHGLLFAGPEGVGKRTIALRLANDLLNPTPYTLNPNEEGRGSRVEGRTFHPDLLEIDGSLGIKIEQIRELNYKLSLKPYQAKYKVALINDAENLTTEAANALLKVLEEPKSYTIIILITSNPSRLPKTIVSRTQKITFGLVRNEEFESMLDNLSVEKKNFIKQLASGRPGAAIKIANDENIQEELAQASHYFEVFSDSSMIDRLLTAAQIAELETPQISSLLQNWLIRLSQELKTKFTINLKQRIEQVSLAQKFLDQNVNSKLLLTNLMLNT